MSIFESPTPPGKSDILRSTVQSGSRIVTPRRKCRSTGAVLGGSLARFVLPSFLKFVAKGSAYSSCGWLVALVRAGRCRGGQDHKARKGPLSVRHSSSLTIHQKESQAKFRMRCIRLALTVASGARGVGWMSPVPNGAPRPKPHAAGYSAQRPEGAWCYSVNPLEKLGPSPARRSAGEHGASGGAASSGRLGRTGAGHSGPLSV